MIVSYSGSNSIRETALNREGGQANCWHRLKRYVMIVGQGPPVSHSTDSNEVNATAEQG